MKPKFKTVFLLALLVIVPLFSSFAQADDKSRATNSHDKPEREKSVELKITKAGTGEATIISAPAGIQCGTTCESRFPVKTTVTLTAAVLPGSAFKRWGGACQGSALTCTVALKDEQNVTAVIDLLPITLTVNKAGSGTGIVTSTPAGIDCGLTCSATYKQIRNERDDDEEQHSRDNEHDKQDRDKARVKRPVTVTLTAMPAAGSLFTGWSGACAGSTATCTVTMTESQNVTATFTPQQQTLTVATAGTGNGNILSLQTGIDCGTTCGADFDWNTPVTLAATPATGSTFDGWSGACTGTAATCTVTMDQAQTVTASFSLMQMTLTVAKTGIGNSSITSTPAGIDCGATCTGSYAWNTSVTLTAVPAADTVFKGWSGACTGTTTTCSVTMDQAQNVSADFAPALQTLSLAKTGSGSGSIVSAPAGIDCGTACSASFTSGSTVTLTASPAAGSTFTGWFGACTGASGSCTVTLSQAKTVGAIFGAPAVTTYQYDANGNMTQIADPLGRIRQIQYDALNQPVRQLEPHPTAIGSTLGQINFGYDNLGQIASITDPRNLTTQYRTDSLGNRTQQTSPDTGLTESGYDAAGNLSSRTDARSKTAAYHYDSLNRLVQIDYDDQTVVYTWDTCANGIGRLCSLGNAGSRLDYQYDSHGRLTGYSQSAGAASLSVSHQYNAAGQRIQTVTASGQTLSYQWTGHRLTAILVNGQTVLSQIGYEPDGQVNGWRWGNNQTAERFYNQAGRLSIVSLGFDSLGLASDNRYIGYDAAGRVTDIIADSDAQLNQRHEYDHLDRLTGSQRGETAPRRTDYRYDLSGNRTGKNRDVGTATAVDITYSLDPVSNRLAGQSDNTTLVNYSYDLAGHLISDGTFNYTYNAAGQRTAASAAGLNAGYRYNALGQRIGKTVNGITRQYLYDEQGHLTGEYDAAGAWLQEIVWLGDLPVAVLKPSADTVEIDYIHADHLGTPRKITRPSDNKPVWIWESEAFGNSLPDQNPAGLSTFEFNLRFPGQYYDAETGLHYNMARYYNPRIGRYESSDPIGLEGGVNTYAYVRNNPINSIDPLGLSDVVFDRSAGTISIYDNQGNQVGEYPAANNTTSTSGGPWPDGTYNYSHYMAHPESDAKGPYGSNGNFVFDVPGRTGMGIHSGRSGPQSKTLGCVRTTDEATDFLKNLNNIDPLKTIKVQP